jgi:hypothetical protein
LVDRMRRPISAEYRYNGLQCTNFSGLEAQRGDWPWEIIAKQSR